jgi:hypothetical protein
MRRALDAALGLLGRALCKGIDIALGPNPLPRDYVSPTTGRRR